MLQRLLSRSRALTWFLFSSRSCAPSVRRFYSFALSSPDAVRVSLALSRPLCLAFDFFRALTLRRRFCFSRALAPRRCSISGAPFAADVRVLLRSCLDSVRVSFAILRTNHHPPFAFSRALAPRRRSISRAPSARRLFSFALSRPLYAPVAHPFARRSVSLALSRSDAVRVFSRFRASFAHHTRHVCFLSHPRAPPPAVRFLSCTSVFVL